METALQSLKRHLPQVAELHLWPPGSTLDDATTLLLVMEGYHPKSNTLLLQNAEAGMSESLAHLRPAIVTRNEYQELLAVGDNGSLTRRVAHELQQRQPDYPHLRSIVTPALHEMARLLRLLEQEFVNAGLDSRLLGLRLQGILERLLQWTAALHKLEWRGDKDDWVWFHKQWCGADSTFLFEEDFAHFPLELTAFQERQRLLQELPRYHYPENDKEVDRLLRSLQIATDNLRRYARRTLHTPEEKKETQHRILFAVGAVVLVALIVFGVGWWWTRPKFVTALKGFKPPGKASGIAGYYYGGRNFNKLLLKRTDRTIDMVWRGSPGRGVGSNRFSVRWSGYLWIDRTGDYKFCFRHDDGGRMTLSGQVVSADWRHGSSREQCRLLRLEKGWHPLKAEMYESRGMAVAQLLWQPPGQTKTTIVPSGKLCCTLASIAARKRKARKKPSVRTKKKVFRKKPSSRNKLPGKKKVSPRKKPAFRVIKARKLPVLKPSRRPARRTKKQK